MDVATVTDDGPALCTVCTAVQIRATRGRAQQEPALWVAGHAYRRGVVPPFLQGRRVHIDVPVSCAILLFNVINRCGTYIHEYYDI